MNQNLQILNSIPQMLQPQYMPDGVKSIPPLPAHLMDVENLTMELLAPSKFFSMANLEDELNGNGKTSLPLTLVGLSYELVFDPTTNKEPTSDDWQLCAHFEERKELLVLNARNRLSSLRHICGSSLIPHWIAFIKDNKPRVSLHIGDIDGKKTLAIDAAMTSAPHGNVINITPPEEDEIPF